MTEAEREQRNYYLKSYAGWWATMALLGSLLLDSPSKSLWKDVYNPVVWSAAALLAFATAAVQTHYRERVNRVVNHPLFFWTGMLVYLLFQIENVWRRQIADPSVGHGVMLGILCFGSVLVLLGCIAGLHLTFFAKKNEPREKPSAA